MPGEVPSSRASMEAVGSELSAGGFWTTWSETFFRSIRRSVAGWGGSRKSNPHRWDPTVLPLYYVRLETLAVCWGHLGRWWGASAFLRFMLLRFEDGDVRRIFRLRH